MSAITIFLLWSQGEGVEVVGEGTSDCFSTIEYRNLRMADK